MGPRAGEIAALCSTLGLLTACSDCPRAGCDALSSPAAAGGDESAIAGVIASESDVVGNGCQECSFGSTQLTFWKTPSAIGDAASARAVVQSSSPTATTQADVRYEQALDPGTYLVCSRPDCVSVQVVAGRVTTVHVKLIYGPTQFVVFDPGNTTADSPSTFEVGL